jgi:hypothetical protein
MKKEFPDMFKPTSRCKIPHLNIDVLRDDLFSSNFVFNYQIMSEAELEKKLLQINEQLQEKYQKIMNEEKDMEAYSKAFENAFEKSKKFQFYLGMEKQWIFQSFEDNQRTMRKEQREQREQSSEAVNNQEESVDQDGNRKKREKRAAK